MLEDLEGKVVSEEEAAKGLGFADVTEFRRWQTDLGTKVSELEYALKQAEREIRGFQWHGLRMQRVLERLRDLLKSGQSIPVNDALLAIGVVCGGAVDWDNEVTDWYTLS